MIEQPAMRIGAQSEPNRDGLRASSMNSGESKKISRWLRQSGGYVVPEAPDLCNIAFLKTTAKVIGKHCLPPL
jgi:hypothetical protein